MIQPILQQAQIPGTTPTILLATLSVIGTLAGVWLSWYLTRGERIDELRAIAYKEKIKLISDFDQAIRQASSTALTFTMGFGRKIGATVAKKNFIEVAKGLQTPEEAIPEDIDVATDTIQEAAHMDASEAEKRAESSVESVMENYEDPKLTSVKLTRQLDHARRTLTKCTMLLGDDTLQSARDVVATLEAIEKKIRKTKSAHTYAEEGFTENPLPTEELSSLRNDQSEFFSACRDELGIDDLNSDTKRLIEGVSGTSFPDIPTLHFEAKITT